MKCYLGENLHYQEEKLDVLIQNVVRFMLRVQIKLEFKKKVIPNESNTIRKETRHPGYFNN